MPEWHIAKFVKKFLWVEEFFNGDACVVENNIVAIENKTTPPASGGLVHFQNSFGAYGWYYIGILIP